MMLLRMGAAALNQTPLDWRGNRQRISALLQRACEQGIALLCLPEMCITGYGCEDAFLGHGTLAEAQDMLRLLLPQTKGMVVSLGLPIQLGHGIYNAAAVIADGRLVGFAAKRFLAGDGVHYEPRWFKPWPEGKVAEVQALDSTYPIGDLVFDVGGVRLGFEICEDAWVAGRPGAGFARSSVDVILNPSASHFAFAKVEVRQRFVVEGSRAFGAAYIYANLLGNEAGRVIYDGGPMVAAGGEMLAQAPRFSFAEDQLVHAVVDIQRVRMQQARVASFQPDPSSLGPRLVKADFAWPALAPEKRPPSQLQVLSKEQEFLRAEALALFDYLRKSRTQGFVVSLSGGCDSTSVVALIAASLHLAAAELGLPGVKARLAHVRGIENCSTLHELLGHILTTAYQATSSSGAITKEAAQAVAGCFGARHYDFDVDPLVRAYVALAEQALGRTLSWKADDLALQNVQARVRGPGVWLLANIENKLLLTTSNRSEAALGYATMDGDTCGGLAPLAGIDKAFLRRWLVWLQNGGCSELGPLPALGLVTNQRSTPELRPLSEAQFSEEDLMPFDVLDRIEKLAIRDKLPPIDVFHTLAAERPEVQRSVLAQWVRRFFGLLATNQWKRERYAPSFHLDDANLDPKTWFRFPILSGGFASEVDALAQHLNKEQAS